MIPTLVAVLGPTDWLLLCAGVVVLFVVMLIAFRGPGWLGRALSFAGGWLCALAALWAAKRVRPPQWEGLGPEPTDIVDPRGRTQDHPDG